LLSHAILRALTSRQQASDGHKLNYSFLIPVCRERLIGLDLFFVMN